MDAKGDVELGRLAGGKYAGEAKQKRRFEPMSFKEVSLWFLFESNAISDD